MLLSSGRMFAYCLEEVASVLALSIMLDYALLHTARIGHVNSSATCVCPSYRNHSGLVCLRNRP